MQERGNSFIFTLITIPNTKDAKSQVARFKYFPFNSRDHLIYYFHVVVLVVFFFLFFLFFDIVVFVNFEFCLVL